MSLCRTKATWRRRARERVAAGMAPREQRRDLASIMALGAITGGARAAEDDGRADATETRVTRALVAVSISAAPLAG